MIEPPRFEPRVKPQNLWFCDIETDNGDLLDIGVIDHTGEYHLFQSWRELLDHADGYSDICMLAHNGGGFDWLSLIEWCIDQDIKFSAAKAGSKVVRLSVGDVQFFDTLLVLNASLDKLGESLLGRRKIDGLDYTNMRAERVKNTERYFAYLKRDCELLRDIVERVMDMLDLLNWPMTAAGLAFKLWRERFLDTPIYAPTGDTDTYINESYAGGRTELFQPGHYRNVEVIDANSMYPSVMLNYYPVDAPVLTLEAEQAFNDRCHGFYRIEYEQVDKTKPPCLWMRKKDTQGEALLYQYNVTGTYALPEVIEAAKHGKIIFIDAMIHSDTKPIFSEYVDTFYKMRLQGGAFKTVAKLLLNALYGKFAQRPENKSIKLLDTDQVFDYVSHADSGKPYKGETVLSVEELSKTHPVYNITTASVKPVYCRSIQIASYVTSYARVNLYHAMLAAGEGLVYTDTDSVHYLPKKSKSFQQLIGNKLGQWKLEYSGIGTYVGRKIYALKKEGQETLKTKGVSRNAGARCVHIYELLKGSILPFQSTNPPSVSSVSRGTHKACQFIPNTRRLRANFNRVSEWKRTA